MVTTTTKHRTTSKLISDNRIDIYGSFGEFRLFENTKFVNHCAVYRKQERKVLSATVKIIVFLNYQLRKNHGIVQTGERFSLISECVAEIDCHFVWSLTQRRRKNLMRQRSRIELRSAGLEMTEQISASVF